MNMQILLVRLAGQRVAFPATEIDSVVDLESITPVPGAPAYVAGLSTLRSRAVTVIDCLEVLGRDENPTGANEDRHDLGGRQRAAVFAFEGHDYALLVDAVEDVCEAVTAPASIPGGAGARWSVISEGLIETKSGSAMLVDPHAFVTQRLARAA